MFNGVDLDQIISIFGQNKVEQRIKDYKLYLSSFLQKYKEIKLKYSLDDCSVIFAMQYFNNLNNVVKLVLNDYSLSNRFKISSCSTFTILSLELLYQDSESTRKVNLLF
jgi:hypothetical protein